MANVRTIPPQPVLNDIQINLTGAEAARLAYILYTHEALKAEAQSAHPSLYRMLADAGVRRAAAPGLSPGLHKVTD